MGQTHLILLIIAFVCALMAAVNVPPVSRLHLGWLAFAFFVASLIVTASGVIR